MVVSFHRSASRSLKYSRFGESSREPVSDVEVDSGNTSSDSSVQALLGVRGVFNSLVLLLLVLKGKKNKTRLPIKKIKEAVTYNGKLAVHT